MDGARILAGEIANALLGACAFGFDLGGEIGFEERHVHHIFTRKEAARARAQAVQARRRAFHVVR